MANVDSPLRNNRLKRVLFFEPERSARDSEVRTVHRVVTRLVRSTNRRRLSPGADPAAGRHVIDVDICMLGRRGLCFSLSSESLQSALITKEYMCGGTRHEKLPVHVTVDPGLDIIELCGRLEAFETALAAPQTIELTKWQPANLSSTTYLPSGGSFHRFLESLPASYRSFRWKRRANGAWYNDRVPFHVSL